MNKRINEINKRLDYLYKLNDSSFDDEIIKLEDELKSLCWEIDAKIY